MKIPTKFKLRANSKYINAFTFWDYQYLALAGFLSLFSACATNPIPIIIPCHRVTGAGGRMTGYSAGEGIETKRALLRLEGATLI